VRLAALALVCGTVLGAASATAGPAAKAGGHWAMWGYDHTQRNAGPAKTGLTAANVGTLQRQQIQLGGTVDSSPMYVRAARIAEGVHDAFIVQTTFGLAYAIDADTGNVLWQFTPDGYSAYAGTYQITTASPVIDPDRGFVYSVSPDGLVHKLGLADGVEVRSDGWPARLTLDPAHEKITSPLGLWRKYLTASTSSFGDVPPYQGHLVTLDRDTGRVVSVWNALCSDRHELMDPTTCRNTARTEILSGASIWARTGAVRQPGTGNILLTTANGIYDAHTRWSSSVVMLSPDGKRVLKYFTPANWETLSSQDWDLGSTNPALVTSNLVLQGGKDRKLRLVDLRRFHSPPSVGKEPVLGSALQTFDAPGSGIVFTAPAVWTSKGVRWVFVSTSKGLSAYVLKKNRLARKWTKTTGGTSPVVAGGLLYVYDWDGGALNVYVPTTGKLAASLPMGRGHWNTPIVTDGRIALGQEDANAQVTFGVLNIYRLP
jgi:outer membrane protein assembly factor BamB